ncbi:MAG: ABC transporter substrate-binding protein [Paucibacter sp.]|nr:ABC transporter substrate-binding protein [Roseateles sp.]
MPTRAPPSPEETSWTLRVKLLASFWASRAATLGLGAWLTRLLMGVVAVFGACLAHPSEAITFYTEISEPQTFYRPGQQTLTGFSFDLINEMASRAGVPATVTTSVPWGRAQTMVADPVQADACLFSVTKTPERLPKFQWVGPLGMVKWTLFARADFDASVRNLEDVRPFRIGGYNRDARTEYLVRELGFKVDIAPDDKINPKKLATGRIDLWISNLDNGARTAESAGFPGVKPVLTFNEVYNYLACGPSVPKPTIAALQLALDSINADGMRARIARRYQMK